MTDKLTIPQIQTFAKIIAAIFQSAVKPLQLECYAQADVLKQMSQYGPDIAKKVDIALNAARLSPSLRQQVDQEGLVALDKALHKAFGNSQDPTVLEELRKTLGFVN